MHFRVKCRVLEQCIADRRCRIPEKPGHRGVRSSKSRLTGPCLTLEGTFATELQHFGKKVADARVKVGEIRLSPRSPGKDSGSINAES